MIENTEGISLEYTGFLYDCKYQQLLSSVYQFIIWKYNTTTSIRYEFLYHS